MAKPDGQVVDYQTIDRLDMPRRIDGILFHNSAMTWLGLQHRLSGLSENLKKIGIKLGEDIPNWTKYILTRAEWNHGLATTEKGEWSNDFVMHAKSEAQLPELQQKFACGMMWQMTRDIKSDRKNLVVNLKYVRDRQGVIKDVVPEPGSREWPMYVRVLKRGTDGKPIAFVDVKVEKNLDRYKNPYEAIDWQRIIENDEKYIMELGDVVGEQRYFEDWYIEKSSPDKYGKYFRPDIIIGSNTHDFAVNNMSSDRRSLISVGFDVSRGKVGGVRVSSTTHLPYVGKHMLGQSPTEKKPNLSMSAYEATMRDPELLEMIDSNHGNDIENYIDWRRSNDVNVFPMQSFLSTRLAPNLADDRNLIETMLRYGSFESKDMAKFSAFVNAQKMVVGKTISEDLALELKETPKRLKSQGKNIAGILFFNFAIFLQGFRGQGYAIAPEDESKLLGYGSVKNGPLRRMKLSAELMKNKENEQKTFDRLDQMSVISDCIKLVEVQKNSDEALDSLRKDVSELNMDELSSRDAYKVALIRDVAGNYFEDMKLINAEGVMLQAEKGDLLARRLGSIPIFEYENPSINPSTSDECGLMDFMVYENSVFENMLDSVKGEGDMNSDELEILESYSKELLKFGNMRKGFPLRTSDVALVLRSFKANQFDFTISEEEVDWGTIKKADVSIRVNQIRRAIFDTTIARYSQDGVKYLLAEAENEAKLADDQNVESVYSELLSKSLSATQIINELMKHPNRSVADISVRLGILSVLEKFGESGAGEIIASARPEDNASKLVTKDVAGMIALFETALGATRTTRGFAQENDRFSLKESIDNPRNMLDILVPFLRADSNLSGDFRAYLVRNQVDEESLELFKRVIYDDEFACFADETIKEDYITDQARLWGSKYEDKLVKGAFNVRERGVQLKEATRLFELFNGFMEEANKGSAYIERENHVKIREFMNGGFANLWNEINNFRMQAIQTEMARVLLLFSMSPSDESKRVELRTIFRREKANLQNMHTRLRTLFLPIDKGNGSEGDYE